MDIKVYGKTGCGWCDKMSGYLSERRMPHTQIDIMHSPQNYVELREIAPDAKLVPQVVVDGKLIGGYHEAVAYFQNLPRDGK